MVRQAHHDVILSHAGLGSMETMALRGPAKLLIDRHGTEAASYGGGRANLLLEEGDPEGSAVWQRILVAIEELQRARRAGEVVKFRSSICSDSTPIGIGLRVVRSSAPAS
jgi:hypothetical protein